MRIRKATQQDLHSIMQLYENARAFMREHGNPGQWGTTYPPQNMIETDIRFGNLYVCIEKDTIEAVLTDNGKTMLPTALSTGSLHPAK